MARRTRYGDRVTRRRAALLGGIALVLAGCRSAPDAVESSPNRTELLARRIEAAFERDAGFVDWISRGVDRSLLDATSQARLWRRALDRQITNYRAALTDDDYAAAYVAARNVHYLREREPFDDATTIAPTDEILHRWAASEFDRGRLQPALYLQTRRSSVTDLDDDALIAYHEAALALNHYALAERLARAAAERNLAVAPLPARPDARAMLSGTVTVWVNRGIVIENGVGFPDRVIGSGFFVDPRGYLLTNYHVIASEVDPEYEGFSRLFVKLPGRPEERLPAHVVGHDRVFDLALLKVQYEPPFVFSPSDKLDPDPGQTVLALGSPGGLDSTLTAGIVSSPSRRFLQLGDVVQVDVPINPGNSGGPLVDQSGNLLGVVFAGVEQFEGINFAIPSGMVHHVLPRLFESGELRHAWLGAAVREERDRLVVTYVAPESPAHRLGLQPGDRVLAIDGVPSESILQVQRAALPRRPGEFLALRWERDAIARTSTIELAARPFSPIERALDRQSIQAVFPVLYGMNVERVSNRRRASDYVVTEVFPGGIADESSLSADDPFALRSWRVDLDLRAAFIEIIIRKRKTGFLKTGIQLGAFLETNTFI